MAVPMHPIAPGSARRAGSGASTLPASRALDPMLEPTFPAACCIAGSPSRLHRVGRRQKARQKSQGAMLWRALTSPVPQGARAWWRPAGAQHCMAPLVSCAPLKADAQTWLPVHLRQHAVVPAVSVMRACTCCAHVRHIRDSLADIQGGMETYRG